MKYYFSEITKSLLTVQQYNETRGSQTSELETIKENFLMKKLGLKDSPDLMAGINSVIETYGKSNRNKYRAVVYYLLVKHFKKEGVYA